MSTYWICDRTGERFDDYDEAWEDYLERYDDDYLSDYFMNYISYSSLLHWAMQQNAFWNDRNMINALDEAEQRCFEDFYIEHEEEDE